MPTTFIRPIVRLLGVFAVVVGAVALSGCGLSSVTSGLGGGLFGGGKSATDQVNAVTEAQLLSAAKADFGGQQVATNVAHGCPKFIVLAQENFITIYDEGRIGEALAVRHRGEITKTARECAIEPGRVTVKYGFSGRILLGPRGAPGRVSLPVNVFVADGTQKQIVGDKLTVDVDVSSGNPIGYFSQVRTVTFAVPEGSRPGEFQVQVGFDSASVKDAG